MLLSSRHCSSQSSVFLAHQPVMAICLLGIPSLLSLSCSETQLKITSDRGPGEEVIVRLHPGAHGDRSRNSHIT